MKTLFGLIGIFALFAACHNKSSHLQDDYSHIMFLPEDRLIAENLLSDFAGDKKIETGELILKVGTRFLDIPYVANTLENGKDENMVVNLRELDCTTFTENVLALVRTIQSREPDFNRFVKEVEKIRYRGGDRDGYLSRLHYFSDWIFNNQEKKIIRDVSRDIAHILYPNQVDFMSKHPDSYAVLKENPGLVEELKRQESIISSRMAWYVPKKNIPELERQIKNGDVIAITTHIAGLDIMHVGFAIWIDDSLKLLHASTNGMKVVITEETLSEYLGNRKTASGIMVARAL